MIRAASVSSGASGPEGPRRGRPVIWRRWLLLGVGFGLGYGLTQRLMNLQIPSGWNFEQRFEVKPFPGTELETLRHRSADGGRQIRADLDRLELQRQSQRQAATIERRRAELSSRDVQGEPGGNAVVAPPIGAAPPPPQPPSSPPPPPPASNPPPIETAPIVDRPVAPTP